MPEVVYTSVVRLERNVGPVRIAYSPGERQPVTSACVDTANGRLTAEVTGEVETEERVLVLRRIHVAMTLVAAEDQREIVERVHGMFAMRCPLFGTFQAIEITSSYTLVAPPAP